MDIDQRDTIKIEIRKNENKICDLEQQLSNERNKLVTQELRLVKECSRIGHNWGNYYKYDVPVEVTYDRETRTNMEPRWTRTCHVCNLVETTDKEPLELIAPKRLEEIKQQKRQLDEEEEKLKKYV